MPQRELTEPGAVGHSTQRDADAARPEGYDTDAELQAHLADLEARARFDDDIPLPFNSIDDDRQSALERLEEELDILRDRLAIIKLRTENVVRASAEWADASAHAQLGSYPWAKLLGAMTVAFAGGRLLRQLPLRAFATAALPLMAARLNSKRDRWR